MGAAPKPAADGAPLDDLHVDEPRPSNERRFVGPLSVAVTVAAVLYAAWHLYVLNIAPLETWTFRIAHVAGTLALGFVMISSTSRADDVHRWGAAANRLRPVLFGIAGVGIGWAAFGVATAGLLLSLSGKDAVQPWLFTWFGPALATGSLVAIVTTWLMPGPRDQLSVGDALLAIAALTVAGFLLINLDAFGLRLRAGTSFADPQNAWAAFVGIVLILEITRRVAGLALVAIAAVFVAYAFLGPWLPGFLNHNGYDAKRFFTYVYTDNGILGPTTAVSSTYIILFIMFAAFLQSSRVAEYFVNFAFATAGRARGGPAKVAVLASGLMGTINGTSAGNVVATGSVTIPLMKRVGYRPKSAAAIEAGASTGGQIMPPIMGAGAFIMAEVTGIPYTDLIVAALIPAILYFASIYFMVDFEALRMGLKGMRQEDLPQIRQLLRQVYLFAPLLILIGALFLGYSVIRAGGLAIVAAIMVSWLTPHRLGLGRVLAALADTTRMALQIIAVCACAGVIVGVISLTGVGARFSALLLDLAAASQLLALIFAMLISIILGMGMPTTAAYAVAASVVAPGLIQLGIDPLVAHFFVFYFAVVSAITPPVALAAYAGAGIAGSDPIGTAVASFKIGLAAFIVPFMFFYSPGLLLEADGLTVARNLVTALVGVYLLSAAVQGWFLGRVGPVLRTLLLGAALCMISGTWVTDLIGLMIAAALAMRRWPGPNATETEISGAAGSGR